MEGEEAGGQAAISQHGLYTAPNSTALASGANWSKRPVTGDEGKAEQMQNMAIQTENYTIVKSSHIINHTL